MPHPALPPRELVTPDTPLRLEVAAKLAFPDGSMSASVLRGEAERGRLDIRRIGRRYYTTLRNIETMWEKCRVAPRDHASGCAPQEGTRATESPIKPPGSSGTDHFKAQQAAAMTTLLALRDQLAEYIAGKHVTTAAKGKRRSNEDIPISDALATYGRDVAANRSRPRVGLARLARLIAEIGALPLSEINGSLCRDYAARRGSLSAARRELEDLRAAIGHYHDEGLCRDLPRVILPAKPPNRERWITRSEAARLIWAAWRFREVQFGKAGRASRQHVARFILIGLYTGTRAGAVCIAAFKRSPSYGWIDTERGVFQRRPESRAETKKRQPPVPLPRRLLAHLRRWESA